MTAPCQACQAARQPAPVPRPDTWPPVQPADRSCSHPDCAQGLAWQWRPGPWDGPRAGRGRWLPPEDHLCPTHVAAADAALAVARAAAELAGCGLPGRLQSYDWSRTSEYTDSDGAIVHSADRGSITQAAFARFQAALPPSTLGITPWNKSLALVMRGLCRPDARVDSWLIMGPVGSGKSTMVAATVAGLVRAGRRCRYVTETDLWAMVRRQWGQTARKHHRTPDVVQDLVDVPILALDDIGTIEAPKPWHVDGMERLICGRYDAGRPVLLTTNATLQQLADSYGERVASRLAEMLGRGDRYMQMGGPDWRTGRIRSSPAAPAPAADTTTGACSECGYDPCRMNCS